MTTGTGGAAGWEPGPRTRLAAVIGDPVRHSLSPVLHNAGFRALGLDWAYVAFEVPGGAAPSALAGMRALGIEGLNVTMPHKADVAAAVDRCSPTAAALGAVNTVVRAGGALVGHNTDGEGFVASVRADVGFDPAGQRCLVLGAGGAARAVVRALAEAGAAEVVVAARRTGPAEVAARLAGDVGRVGPEAEADDCALVVNATPVGMAGVEAAAAGKTGGATPAVPTDLPLAAERLGPGQVVVDLVYDPLVTPLVATARARGALAANGIGMLIHQAALAFRLWTGEDAPIAAMTTAVQGRLTRSHDILT
jgi:shikimate dehydrogenase